MTVAAVSWASVGVSASAASETAGSVLAAARSAIGAEAGVQVSFVAHSSATPKTETIVADIGRTSGEETTSVGTAHVAVRVTPAFAYVSGNASGLTTLFGLSAAQAAKAGRRWVSWKAGTRQYGDLKTDVTMASVTDLLPKGKGTTLSSEVAGAATLYLLSWTVAASGSAPRLSNRLTVSAAGLPVVGTSDASNGLKATTTLSGWGTLVPVTPPPATATVASSRITG
jgi:hypothetical protein